MEDKEMMGNSTGQRVGGSPQSRPEGIPDDLQRLENLDDWEIAESETDPRGFEFVGVDKEKIGTIDSLLASPSTQRAHFAIVDTDNTDSERKFLVPLDRVTFGDGKAFGPFTRAQLLSGPAWADGERDLSRYTAYWMGIGRGAQGSASGGSGYEYRVPLTEETADVRKAIRPAGRRTP